MRRDLSLLKNLLDFMAGEGIVVLLSRGWLSLGILGSGVERFAGEPGGVLYFVLSLLSTLLLLLSVGVSKARC